MTYAQMERKIRTAGSWFVGAFMGEFLAKYPQYSEDSSSRVSFIQYIHREYGENLDYSYESTKTKCYALISIIENHVVLEALEYVINSNENKVGADAIENAIELADAISKGIVALP